jgi:hypothetical protein
MKTTKVKTILLKSFRDGSIKHHIERHGYEKTYCGENYYGDWQYGEELDLSAPEFDLTPGNRNPLYCQTCIRAAKWKKIRTDKRKKPLIPEEIRHKKREWYKHLSLRSSNVVRYIVVCILHVATDHSLEKMTEDEVKAVIKKAIELKIIAPNLKGVKGAGIISAREINHWIGYREPDEDAILLKQFEKFFSTAVLTGDKESYFKAWLSGREGTNHEHSK